MLKGSEHTPRPQKHHVPKPPQRLFCELFSYKHHEASRDPSHWWTTLKIPGLFVIIFIFSLKHIKYDCNNELKRKLGPKCFGIFSVSKVNHITVSQKALWTDIWHLFGRREGGWRSILYSSCLLKSPWISVKSYCVLCSLIITFFLSGPW
jgi:hypothetical protein